MIFGAESELIYQDDQYVSASLSSRVRSFDLETSKDISCHLNKIILILKHEEGLDNDDSCCYFHRGEEQYFVSFISFCVPHST